MVAFNREGRLAFWRELRWEGVKLVVYGHKTFTSRVLSWGQTWNKWVKNRFATAAHFISMLIRRWVRFLKALSNKGNHSGSWYESNVCLKQRYLTLDWKVFESKTLKLSFRLLLSFEFISKPALISRPWSDGQFCRSHTRVSILIGSPLSVACFKLGIAARPFVTANWLGFIIKWPLNEKVCNSGKFDNLDILNACPLRHKRLRYEYFFSRLPHSDSPISPSLPSISYHARRTYYPWSQGF